MRQDEHAQDRFDAIEAAIRVEREKRNEAVAELEAQVARLIDESISASKQRFVVLRRAGVALVILGSALLSASNFVS